MVEAAVQKTVGKQLPYLKIPTKHGPQGQLFKGRAKKALGGHLQSVNEGAYDNNAD